MSYGEDTDTEVGPGGQVREPLEDVDTGRRGTAAEFRAEHGILQGTLKHQRDRFRSLDRWLTKARITATYDEYLIQSLGRSGLVVAIVLVLTVIAGIVTSILPLGVLEIQVTEQVPFAIGLLALIAVVTFVASMVMQYYYPRVWADFRRRRIESTLPHAVIFMYALSEGDVNLAAIMRKLADSEGAYGEISGEFRAIVNDIDTFKMDTLTALEEGKRRSPSEEFQEFLDDLMSVFGSGGDLNTFLRNRSEDQLQSAREQQESFLESLAALVEGYITLVFAGPIFLIVLLIIMSFAGSSTELFVEFVTYGFIPLGIISFLFTVHILNTQHDPGVEVELPDEVDVSMLSEFETENAEAYRSEKRRRSIRKVLRQPFKEIRREPLLSLWFTIPLGWVLWSALIITGVASPTIEAYQDDPFWVTTMLIVVPLAVPSLGLMFAHEVERRRIEDVKRRFPEMLGGLASANKNGIRFVDCIPLVARQSEGVLAQYMRKLDNDIRATRDVYGSLRRFAADVDVPRVARVTSIIVEGHKSSGSLHHVLGIAADDAKERARLDTFRSQTMYPYLVFFTLGVFVYLIIALLLTEVMFPAISELNAAEDAVDQGQLFASGGANIPIESFEIALYHSLLIQAFGNGLVIGKLLDNKLMSGLKYANVLTLIVVIVFFAAGAYI
jgi:flagellar protein FlaJ